MRAIPKWVEKIHEQSDKSEIARWEFFSFQSLHNFQLFPSFSIHATCFHPDAIQLIVGAGDKVLVYDAADGNLLDTLKGKENR